MLMHSLQFAPGLLLSVIGHVRVMGSARVGNSVVSSGMYFKNQKGKGGKDIRFQPSLDIFLSSLAVCQVMALNLIHLFLGVSFGRFRDSGIVSRTVSPMVSGDLRIKTGEYARSLTL